MAEPHAHSQPIQTYGPAPHNRNIWPHNSRATVFCLRFCRFFCFGEPSLPTTDSVTPKHSSSLVVGEMGHVLRKLETWMLSPPSFLTVDFSTVLSLDRLPPMSFPLDS